MISFSPQLNTIRTDFVVLLLVVVLGLSACADTGPEAGTSGDEVTGNESLLNRGNGTEPRSLDAHNAATVDESDVLRDVGEGLLGVSPEGALRPAVALRWAASDDGLEYTFWLRPDARWSNGDAVTAADFVYSYRRLVDPATAALNASSAIDIENAEQIVAGMLPSSELGVEAVDTHQLRIRLQRPLPYFLKLLTFPSMFPVHQASVEKHGDTYARPGNLVSNGAYILNDWQIGAFIEVVRNDFYWNNAQTSIDRVRHYVTSDPIAELNRYRAGELDITRTIPFGSFAQMRKERPDEVRVSPALSVYYYGFNLSNEVFANNLKLRQALSMAIDRETITEKIMGRGEAPAYGWVPEGIADYDTRQFSYASMPATQRLATARRLYQEAGYGKDKPLKLELRYNTGNSHRTIATAVQSMWHELPGLEIELINEQLQVLIANVQEKAVTQIFRLSWTGNYDDAHTFLSIMESDNPSNLTGYESAEFDRLMLTAANQLRPELRKAFLGEAESQMLKDHPLIPIYFYINRSMVSKRVKGWGDNVLDYHYSQHLSLVEK